MFPYSKKIACFWPLTENGNFFKMRTTRSKEKRMSIVTQKLPSWRKSPLGFSLYSVHYPYCTVSSFYRARCLNALLNKKCTAEILLFYTIIYFLFDFFFTSSQTSEHFVAPPPVRQNLQNIADTNAILRVRILTLKSSTKETPITKRRLCHFCFVWCNNFVGSESELEFLNNLWGLGTE